jgi:large subunit ribosomal protein L30
MQRLWLTTEALIWIKYLTVKLRKMAKVKITQVRSKINRPINQKKTLEALGLKKMNQTVELEATPQILGMVNTVGHLVNVEEVK